MVNEKLESMNDEYEIEIWDYMMFYLFTKQIWSSNYYFSTKALPSDQPNTLINSSKILLQLPKFASFCLESDKILSYFNSKPTYANKKIQFRNLV